MDLEGFSSVCYVTSLLVSFMNKQGIDWSPDVLGYGDAEPAALKCAHFYK